MVDILAVVWCGYCIDREGVGGGGDGGEGVGAGGGRVGVGGYFSTDDGSYGTDGSEGMDVGRGGGGDVIDGGEDVDSGRDGGGGGILRCKKALNHLSHRALAGIVVGHEPRMQTKKVLLPTLPPPCPWSWGYRRQPSSPQALSAQGRCREHAQQESTSHLPSACPLSPCSDRMYDQGRYHFHTKQILDQVE